MPSETKSVPPSLSRHRHAWQHRKDLFALWTISGSDPCPTPTHTLQLGLSTHGGRTRSGMEPSIATSVDDTPCLNIHAPLYMVLNFLGPSILIVQICFVCRGEDYKAMEYCVWGCPFKDSRLKNLLLAVPTYVKCHGLPTLSILIRQHWANTKAKIVWPVAEAKMSPPMLLSISVVAPF